jgi:chromosome segregation ATPase
MVNLLKIFNRYKMKAKELQQENEGLKAQIAGLTFNLGQFKDKIQFLENEIQNVFKSKKDLESEVQRLNMLLKTSNTNKNDSRYY